MFLGKVIHFACSNLYHLWYNRGRTRFVRFVLCSSICVRGYRESGSESSINGVSVTATFVLSVQNAVRMKKVRMSQDKIHICGPNRASSSHLVMRYC